MQSEFCHKTFSTKGSLNTHQKTAKYCLRLQPGNQQVETSYECGGCGKMYSRRERFLTHQDQCVAFARNKGIEEGRLIGRREQEATISEKDLLITEKNDLILQKENMVSGLQQELYVAKALLEEANRREQEAILREKESRDDYTKLVTQSQVQVREGSINYTINQAIESKPTTINQNINLPPITQQHIQDNVQHLSLDHVRRGMEGYAQYALEYPLRGMVKCADFARRKLRYKNEEGQTVVDPEMKSLRTKLFAAISDRNKELSEEYIEELRSKLDTGQFNKDSILETMIEAKKQCCVVEKAAEGKHTSEMSDFVKSICVGLNAVTDSQVSCMAEQLSLKN